MEKTLALITFFLYGSFMFNTGEYEKGRILGLVLHVIGFIGLLIIIFEKKSHP